MEIPRAQRGLLFCCPCWRAAAACQIAADKMAAYSLRIITSRFSAIKKAPFLAPVYGL
ncbi:hypothetical protein QYI_0764 [Escherichia coli B7-2]|nr:hypothetical protein QYI_0764 [Escherichia coli B7-2]